MLNVVCTSSKLALEFWSISIGSDRPVSCWTNGNPGYYFTPCCYFGLLQSNDSSHSTTDASNMPHSCHCCLPPAPCALIHRRARRWGSAGAAGGSQKPGHLGKWACTCRCCGKRHRDGWARRRAGPDWRTPLVHFHSRAPLQRGERGFE